MLLGTLGVGRSTHGSAWGEGGPPWVLFEPSLDLLGGGGHPWVSLGPPAPGVGAPETSQGVLEAPIGACGILQGSPGVGMGTLGCSWYCFGLGRSTLSVPGVRQRHLWVLQVPSEVQMSTHGCSWDSWTGYKVPTGAPDTVLGWV